MLEAQRELGKKRCPAHYRLGARAFDFRASLRHKLRIRHVGGLGVGDRAFGNGGYAHRNASLDPRHHQRFELGACLIERSAQFLD